MNGSSKRFLGIVSNGVDQKQCLVSGITESLSATFPSVVKNDIFFMYRDATQKIIHAQGAKFKIHSSACVGDLEFSNPRH